MSKRIVIKNHQQEIRLIQRRSLIALIMMGILVLLLIGRLGFLQVAKHDLYTTLSKKNWLELVPIEPTRGLIYDRHGVLLAENIPVFSLDVLPYQITNVPKMLADIAKIIPLADTDIAQFQKALKQHREFDEIPLKFKLSEDEVARFYENQYRFPGLLIKARLMRYYPAGESFSHVIGYVGRITTEELADLDAGNYSASNNIGKQGIEKYYEDDLHGNVGFEQDETDASGRTIRVLNQIRPIPGKNLYLTIDSGLQKVAEDALGNFRGAIVAIQPATGQILAMVSKPGFDPNLFVKGIDEATFKTLQESTDRPLYDRAIRGLYPPASTIKPYIAISGLDFGTITPEETIYDPGYFELKNSSHIFHDWRFKQHGHGIVNLDKAIMSSCDTYFFNLAFKLGITHIDSMLKQFGFGEETGIDLTDELAGIVPTPEWKKRVHGESWYPGDTLNMGLGQGFMQATPLQMAEAISTIANRGKRYAPSMLLGSQEPGKTYIQEEPSAENSVILHDPSIWATVINGMQDVVRNPQGTAYGILGKVPYTVAGKTGTAQVFSRKSATQDISNLSALPENLHDHTLFIAFAPVDNPQIAIAIIAENSSKGLAAENHGPSVGIAKKIFDYYFLPPNNKVTPNDGTHS